MGTQETHQETMKKLLTTIIFSTFFLSAWAQGVKISGTVKDDTNQPVEFATVALNDPETKKPVDGAICDEKGKFTIKNVASGKYNLTISFIGYEAIVVPLTITNQNIDLDNLQLKSEDKILNEVVVEGQKALIEEKVDRTVYNAENDKTTSGGDATDVLQRVPHLTVDLDGNVSLRGSSNIKIFINNKPSMMAASSVADALKQIPADQIKSVEVITSPSARYDAEGTSGIINIITKKNNLEGLSLNVDGSAGLRGSNLSVNGGYRKGKLGLSLGGFGRAGYNVLGSFKSEQVFANQDHTLQSADTENNSLHGRYTLGFDYDFNKKNYITGSVMYGLRNQNNFQNDLLSQFYKNGSLDRTELANVETVDNSGTVDVNFNYTHLYEKPQQELSFLMLYSKNNRTNDFERFTLDPTDEDILGKIKNDNMSTNQETAFEINYQSPIKENQLIEFGGKQTMRSVSSDYEYFTATGNGAYTPVTDTEFTNVFNYNQDITAGYLSYTVSFNKKYFLKAGGRYEYTTIGAAFAQENSPTDIPDYGTFVPSINVSTNLKNGSTIKAAYNKRIQRPSIQYLNPNVQGSNPLSITIGNPDLEPEYTDNYELSVSKYIQSTSINLTGFVRHTYNSIQSLRNPISVNSDTILTTYRNIGTEDAFGLSLFTNVNVKDRLTLSGGIDTYYAVLDNNTNDKFAAHNEGWVVSGRLFGGYKFDKGWALQLFSFYRGNRVQLQGSQGGFGIYSLTVRKEIMDKRGSIGVGAENFFNLGGMKIKSETITPAFQQNSVNTMQNMNFKVSFSFRFGKMGVDSNPRRKRKTISSDDLKEGGSSDMGGSEAPAGGGSRPSGNYAATASTPVKLAAKNDSVTLNAAGNWEYVIESAQGPSNGVIALTQTDGQYAGTITSSRSPEPQTLKDVKVSGNEFTASYSMNFGGNEVTINIIGMITEDAMEGSIAFGTFRTVPFKATRKKE